MYGNGINNPFMMQNMYGGAMNTNTMMRSIPIMNQTPNMLGIGTPHNGLSSLLGLGRTGGGPGNILGGLKSFNFGNLLTNTSKALGVVKEAIPIVKEVGPMVGNMRQMLKIASIFKDETDSSIKPATNNINNETNIQESKTKESDTTYSTTISTKTNDNEPNFFL